MKLAWPIEHWQLDNGFKVVFQPDPRVPLVDVHTVYGVGAVHDPPDLGGLAHLCEHLGLRCLMEGGRPPRQPLAAAHTSLDGTSFWQTRPVRQLEVALRAEATRMRLSAAPPESLESERQILLRELEETSGGESSPSPLELLSRLLFPSGHGYRRSAAGTPEGIRAIRERHVRELLGHYRPGLAAIALVGDLSREAVEAMVERVFGDLGKATDDVKTPLPVTVEDAAAGGRLSVSSSACRAYVAFRAPAYGEPGRCSATLAARCVGVGRRSPLARELVNRRGVARRVWTQVSRLRSTTLLAFAADGAPDVCPDRLRDEMIAVLHELAQGGISARRLERSRKKALSDLYAYLQRPVVRAEKLALATAFLDDPRHPAEEAERLAAVGLDEVEESLVMLRRPERLATLALGDPR